MDVEVCLNVPEGYDVAISDLLTYGTVFISRLYVVAACFRALLNKFQKITLFIYICDYLLSLK